MREIEGGRQGGDRDGYVAMYLHVYNCVSAAAVVVVFTCFVYKFAYAFFIFSPFFWNLVLFFFWGQETLCSCLCREETRS